MSEQEKKKFKKAAELILAILAGFLLIASIFIFAVFWKLSRGPVDMSWAQPYIQNALGDNKKGIEVDAKGIVAEWESFDSPLLLGIADLSITEYGQEILSVKEVGLQLAKLPIVLGIVLPESIFIKNPAIRLERDEDGRLSFLVANDDRDERNENKLTPQELGDSLFLGNILSDKSKLPLSKLRSIVIQNANITINDKPEARNLALPNTNLSLTRDENKINLVMDFQGMGDDRARVNAVVSRKKIKNEISFLLKVENLDTALWALNLPKLPGLMREGYTFDGQITGLFDTVWELKRLDSEISTSKDAIRQQDFKLSATRDETTNIIPLQLSLEEVSLEEIATLWPKGLEEASVTQWFTEKLSDGIIKNFNLILPFRNEAGRWILSGQLEGSLDFENLTCDYRAPLYPITNGYGNATIKDNVLTINIDSGKLQDLDISKGGSVTITELISDIPGEAFVKLNLKGPLRTVFEYIALEPISLGGKTYLNIDGIEGRGDINVDVSFPTLKDLPAEDIKVLVDATLEDTRLPGIVRGLDLSGGPFDLKVADGAFSLSGNGALENVPLDFSYSEYFESDGKPYASKSEAKIVTDDALRQKFGIDISDYIGGKLPLDLTYIEKTDGNAEVDLKADLTPSQTFVTPLDYLKKEGVAGQATAKLYLVDGKVRKIENLNVKIGNDMALNGQLNFGMVGKENNVTSGSFDRVRLGSINDFSLKINQSSSLLKLDIAGKAIDARSFMNDSEIKNDDEPRTKDVEARIRTSLMRMADKPDQVFTDPKLDIVVAPEGLVKKLDLQGNAGQGLFSARLSPSANGIMELRMDSNDAGAALNALGVYENMRGGQLSLSGAQMPGRGMNDIQGAAVINDFSIVKAPLLAKLIGAFSITGLPEALSNQGISFSKLKSNFIWRESRRGRIINLYDGATSGGSVGLTFGGVINQTNDTIELSGTFVPISQINKIVSSIPIVGKLLTGGKNGGIIAATYSMKGPTDNPNLTVNPLSVLAPGFLRSILFEGGMGSGRDEKPATRQNRN